ncbi:AsnC family transcriptional regulator [Azospirillum sp. YIM B02556]|uniref:siroheme decarboxylase n=1 Tax=Azospirillum endophyticum TaxID=2800326 RepID=A0ABS1FAD6_9PROT|nr:AsnC family transcriptional regulator [Azospirillum endophyticum]MBK1840389.1 AsnC family transcriptional regulator [Azospirillum endophyticum]
MDSIRDSSDPTDRRLLDEFQRGFPLIPRPFAELAARLGSTPADILDRLRRLTAAGAVARVGAAFRPHRVGASTLAAMAVPPGDMVRIAALVGGFEEVNHNYEREHRLNLWFVVTAADGARVRAVLAEIEAATGLPVLDLPLERGYHLDLGFPLWT